jgi:hypothetical protein
MASGKIVTSPTLVSIPEWAKPNLAAAFKAKRHTTKGRNS